MKKDLRRAVAHLDAPFAVLDLDAAKANAENMAHRSRGTPIRVASKSLRIRSLISEVLSLPGYRGVLAYNLNEALWLCEEQVTNDILVAYPSTHREALHRLIHDARALQCVTLMVDSVAHLDFIDAVVPPHERGDIRVCIDIDAALRAGPVHIGALRSPLYTVEEVRAVAWQVRQREGFRLVGLMAYEGQVAGTTDTSPAIAAMKALSVRELASRRAKIVAAVAEELRVAGLPPLEFVNGGGTGSIETTSTEAAVTEIGAGSGIIGSALFDHYRQFQPTPAEWFVVPVVRRPAEQTVTVAGGGRIASGPAGKDRLPVVDWPRDLKMAPLEGPGEVQTPLTGPAARNLRLGDHVWMRHAKAGEATEYIDSVLVVSAGEIIAEWPTYRGEGKSFV